MMQSLEIESRTSVSETDRPLFDLSEMIGRTPEPARDPEPADPLTVGVFVNAVEPKGASQASFQGSILSALERLSSEQFRFVVLSYDIPAGIENSSRLKYMKLLQGIAGTSRIAHLKEVLTRAIRRAAKTVGLGRKISRLFPQPPVRKPCYFDQLKEEGIRLIWNVNQHELRSFLPYIRTIWDVNHRIHSMYPEFSYTRLSFEGLDRNLTASLAKASYVVTGTVEGKRQLEQMFGVYPGKVRVVPFPTPEFTRSDTAGERFERERPYVFYPARFWPHKNHVVILGALKTLRERWGLEIDVVFTGADEGNLDYVMSFAERAGVANQVVALGVVPSEKLAGIYRSALALTFASTVGPDNLPPLEAMALGCPALTADVPGAREQYGDAALFFDPLNECDLAVKIKTLIDDPELRESLVLRGKQRADSWTSDDYVRAVVDVLGEFAKISRSWGKNDSQFT